MGHTHKILSVLLALMLIGSNMAFSGHISSNITSDFGLCSLCIHPGGSDNAIAPEPGLFFVDLPVHTLISGVTTDTFFQLTFPDHQSRAPPSVT